MIVIHCGDSQLKQPLSTQTGRRRRPTDLSRCIFVPPSVTRVLCAARAHFSFLYLQVKSLSISHPVLHTAPGCLCAGLPTTLQTRKPTESTPMCPVSDRTPNTVSLTNDIDRGAVGRPSGVVAPRTHTSSSLACQSFPVARAPLHLARAN